MVLAAGERPGPTERIANAIARPLGSSAARMMFRQDRRGKTPPVADVPDEELRQRPREGQLEPAIEVRTGLGRAPRFVSLVTLYGEQDYASRTRLEDAFSDLHGHVLVDLAHCELIDTATINVILTKHRTLRREGYELELLIPPARVQITRIFNLLGIRNLVTIHDRLPFPT